MNYFEQANIYYAEKNYKKAIEFYKLSIENNKDLSSSYYNTGVCYLKSQEYDIAITYIKNAIQQDNTKSNFYFNLGYCFSMIKNYKQAIINFNKAKKLNPKDNDCEKAINLILRDKPELKCLIEEISDIKPKEFDIYKAEFGIDDDTVVSVNSLIKEFKLLKQIDKALDLNDKDKFMKLTNKLNKLRNKELKTKEVFESIFAKSFHFRR